MVGLGSEAALVNQEGYEIVLFRSTSSLSAEMVLALLNSKYL
jgi:hypothetical protein